MNLQDRKLICLIKVKLTSIDKTLDMLVDFARDDLRRIKIIEERIGIKGECKYSVKGEFK